MSSTLTACFLAAKPDEPLEAAAEALAAFGVAAEDAAREAKGPGSFHVGRPHHIVAFDVVGGRHLVNQRLLAVTAPGFPDGLKVDGEGRVYASLPVAVTVAIATQLREVERFGRRHHHFVAPAISSRSPRLTSRWSAHESQA